MTNLIDHTPNLWAVLPQYCLIDFGQTKASNNCTMFFRSTYSAFYQRYLKHTAHNYIPVYRELFCNTTTSGNLFWSFKTLQTLESGFNNVVRIIRT